MKLLIVIPTYNEEKIIEKNILELFNFCQKNLKNLQWKIIIADNGSNDKTIEKTLELSKKYKGINFLNLKQKGKGRAVIEAWKKEIADIYCFMDADLATSLQVINLAVKFIETNDIVIGSRYIKGSTLQRPLIRICFSRFLNIFLNIFLKTKLTDTPCGFKFVNQKIVKDLLPKIKNCFWFFDTELLVLAEKEGYKIKEIPIEWREKGERKTKVNLLKTSFNYLKEIIKLKIRLNQLNKIHKD